jgi:hypothetical protein
MRNTAQWRNEDYAQLDLQVGMRYRDSLQDSIRESPMVYDENACDAGAGRR